MTVAINEALSDDQRAILEHVETCNIVPILTVENESALAKLNWIADALLAAGVDTIEVTLRTSLGLQAIRTLAARDELTIGAGTVLSPQQAERAVDEGAAFVVSPGFDVRVVERALQVGVPPIPGVATPSEIQEAMHSGLTYLKLFPVEQLGGLAMVRALAGPFPDIRFMVSGGVAAENAAAYLEHPAVSAVGASWITNRTVILNGDSAVIEKLARDARRWNRP